MPKKAEELLSSIGHKFDIKNDYEDDLRKNLWNKTFKLNKLKEPLFVRPESHVDVEKVVENKKKENLGY